MLNTNYSRDASLYNRSYSQKEQEFLSDASTDKVKRLSAECLNLLIYIPQTIVLGFRHVIVEVSSSICSTCLYVIEKITILCSGIFSFIVYGVFIKDPLAHIKLVEIGIALGYKGLETGACNGIALMAIQAGLVKDTTSFNIRIEKLNRLVHKYNGNVLEIVKAIESDTGFLHECLAFFDGISLWRSPQAYSEELPQLRYFLQNSHQHLKNVSPLLASKQLEAKGGLNQVVSFSDVYTLKELSAYLKQLRKVFYKASKEDPISIQFKNVDHTLSIVYDPKTNKWLFSDANQKIVFMKGSDEWVAKKIMQGMEIIASSPRRVILTSVVYSLKKNVGEVKKQINIWRKSEIYKSLHPPDYIKSLSNLQKAAWLYIASQNGHLENVKKLVTEVVNLDIVNHKRETPLWIAAQNNRRAVVKTLLDKGANPDISNQTRNTPLWMASQDNHVGIVKMLLIKGANPDISNQTGNTPLWMASQDNHVEIVKALLDHGANTEIANNEKITPLWIAAQQGHLEIVKALVENGADLNAMDDKGFTPLQIAFENDHDKVVEYLSRKGAKAEIIHEKNPLFTAIQKEDLDTVRALLEEGFNPNNTNSNKVTPLMIAAQKGSLEIVQALLEKEIDVNAWNYSGITALFVAAQEGHVDIVKALLAKGASIDQVNYNGVSPIWVAAQEGHLDVIKMLITKGADSSQVNYNGITPLWVAAQNGHLDVVKVLLTKDSEIINHVNYEGVTPLWVAAQNGHVDVVELLLDEGADIDLTNHNGGSPLLIAAQMGQEDVVDLLLNRGADFTIADTDGNNPLNTALAEGHLEVVKILKMKSRN